MNYRWYYDFDNFEEIYACMPAVRNGTCFSFLECRIKFFTMIDPVIIFEIEGNDFSKREAEEKYVKVSKLLSILFALPLYNTENRQGETQKIFLTNNLLSKHNQSNLNYVEKKIKGYKSVEGFFYEMVDLLIVAFDNLYKYREEDAFVYFFKVIERIAKQYYITYMQRHHTKAVTSKNKSILKQGLKKYALDNLEVVLTEDMLDRKVDLLYKNLKLEFYGSIFNKISLFVTREKILVNISEISRIVKLRNKIAHGDTVADNNLSEAVGICEYLAMQMFSKYFFRKKYEDIHIGSYRYEDKCDPYK